MHNDGARSRAEWASTRSELCESVRVISTEIETSCGLGKFGKVSQVMDSENEPDGKSEMLIYQAEDGKSRIQVRLADGTVWLSQAHMAGLFQTTPQNVTIHIGEIYGDGEVSEAATCKEHLQVRQEGGRAVRRRIKFYNLDLILAVGYRVRSPRGVQFRQWATERLREYLVKGFTLDDERLKGRDRLADYFGELLARIREIRASEVRVISASGRYSLSPPTMWRTSRKRRYSLPRCRTKCTTPPPA